MTWLYLVCAAAPLLLLPATQAEPDHRAAMGFEVEGTWRTAPDLLDEFAEAELWSTRTLPFAELAGGVKLSAEHVKSGKLSGKWADHPRYPTLHTRDLPSDWSGHTALTLWAYSEAATNEAITLAVESDSEATTWRDYFLTTFVVGWQGWRQLVFPLADFAPYEQPAGWQAVGGVYFFTKIFDRQPNPYTVLHLDDMRLVATAPDGPPASPLPPPELDAKREVARFEANILNHPYPETRDGKRVVAPIQYGSYFATERALFGYFPRFQPGFVSFEPGGRAHLQCGSGILESLNREGNWTYRDLVAEVVEPYARKTLGFDSLSVTSGGQGNETAIGFDAEGDAYLLFFISDPTKDWRSRTGLLLHSRGGGQTWRVHKLPFYLARFEKLVGHNRDRLKRPPVILLSKYLSPTTTYLLLPEKRTDGALSLPAPIKVADEAIAFLPHSGEANQVLTHGDTLFLAYGQLRVLPGKTVEDGVPNYAVTYDLKTKQFSKPVLLGFGGINAEDGHNWPAIAVDSKGILHVVINGHHNPFRYTHSLKPWSIDEWTEPVSVAKGTSYCGLVCDKNDTLFTVSRNSDPGYYFRLSLHRKKTGQPWEKPKHLVLPFKPYYKIWYHKLTLEPTTDRLFLSYWSQSGSLCLFKDEYRAYLYTWPDREKSFMTQTPEDGRPRIPLGTAVTKDKPRKYQFYSAPSSEMSILVSADGGDTWHLATTEDFRQST